MPEPPRRARRRPIATLPTTVIDLQASSFDAASGVVTGVTAIRFSPDRNGKAETFDWRLPDTAAAGQQETVTRRQIAAFAPVWPDLSALLFGTLVVAHGAAWARTFLRKATLAVGLEWAPPSFLCSRRMARAFYPDLESYGLDVLIAELALAPEQPTGGADRCLAVAELYRRCLGRMSGSGLSDLTDLDAFMARPVGPIDSSRLRR